jgi:hypothetical protein
MISKVHGDAWQSRQTACVQGMSNGGAICFRMMDFKKIALRTTTCHLNYSKGDAMMLRSGIRPETTVFPVALKKGPRGDLIMQRLLWFLYLQGCALFSCGRSAVDKCKTRQDDAPKKKNRRARTSSSGYRRTPLFIQY